MHRNSLYYLLSFSAVLKNKLFQERERGSMPQNWINRQVCDKQKDPGRAHSGPFALGSLVVSPPTPHPTRKKQIHRLR